MRKQSCSTHGATHTFTELVKLYSGYGASLSLTTPGRQYGGLPRTLVSGSNSETHHSGRKSSFDYYLTMRILSTIMMHQQGLRLRWLCHRLHSNFQNRCENQKIITMIAGILCGHLPPNDLFNVGTGSVRLIMTFVGTRTAFTVMRVINTTTSSLPGSLT